jgi:hypothetical protein
MSQNVNQILEWQSTDGSQHCLLFVEDTSLPHSDIERKIIELAKYNKKLDKWETVEKIDNIDELESFGIPESLVD